MPLGVSEVSIISSLIKSLHQIARLYLQEKIHQNILLGGRLWNNLRHPTRFLIGEPFFSLPLGIRPVILSGSFFALASEAI